MIKNYNKGLARRSTTEGFIALISVVIISFVLLLVATTLGLKGFFSRFNILDSESKTKSAELVNGCIETARLKLANDNSFTTPSDTDIFINTEKCTYRVSSGGKIKAWSVVSKAETYYGVIVNINDPNIPINCLVELSTQADELSTCP